MLKVDVTGGQAALYRFEFSGELFDDVEIRSFYEDDMTISRIDGLDD